VEDPMEKEHFEILLEKVEANTQILAEGLGMVNEHLARNDVALEFIGERIDRMEIRQTRMQESLGKLELGQTRLEGILQNHLKNHR
jgi:4-alpha-glucanotransferase